MPETPSQVVAGLGLTLPDPGRAVGSYSPVLVDGDLALVSGQIVVRDGVAVSPGLVDAEVDVATARSLTRQATLQALGGLAGALGNLDRVRRILRVAVYVASSPGFVRQHEVANGATELLIQVFGESGRPARVAMGVCGLPLNACVEVELLARVTE
ncbi:MAG: RidA family protein [Thermoplasmata archaeon]|nr:RidA family protein [Thermoplasmata archaeon]